MECILINTGRFFLWYFITHYFPVKGDALLQEIIDRLIVYCVRQARLMIGYFFWLDAGISLGYL